jgi:hypothetical protein
VAKICAHGKDGMLNWSTAQYKFTLGIGSLATTALMAELWKLLLPAWVMIALALVPLTVFVFVHPDEMPARFVRLAHVIAAAWYVLTVIALAVGLYVAPALPQGWIILLVGCSPGLIPCVCVLGQSARPRGV